MKKSISTKIIACMLLLMPTLIVAQTAPSLGVAGSFVLFSSIGEVKQVGAAINSHITGNVGSEVGPASSGFGNIDGQIHNTDIQSAFALIDLNFAFLNLSVQGPATPLLPLLSNDTLLPGIYSIPSPATPTLNGVLTLDGQGDPNAYFLLQSGGPFSTAAGAQVKLINGAKACNVFWLVQGAVSIATGTTMRGTIISNSGSIDIASGVTLEGRALSTFGAITVNSGLTAYTPLGCGSPILTGPAAPTLGTLECYALFTDSGALLNTGISAIVGDIGTNGGGSISGFTPAMVLGTMHAGPDPSTIQASSDLTTLNTYLNSLPYDIELMAPYDFGHSLVLTPHVYRMLTSTPPAMLTDTIFLNAQGDSNAVFVIQIDAHLLPTVILKWYCKMELKQTMCFGK